MTKTQSKEYYMTETKKKRRAGEVTTEEMTRFLERPTPKVVNLDRNLRKSYDKNFFKGSEFDGLRDLYKQNK